VQDVDREVIVSKHIGKPRKEDKVAVARRKPEAFSEEKRIEAATLALAVGDLKRVSTLTDVPYKVLQQWSEQDWWFSIQGRCRREHSDIMDVKMSKIIELGMKKVQDRLKKGDVVYNPVRDKTVEVPMTGRDAALVTGMFFDKRQLLRGEATKIVRNNESSEEKLLKLAQKFTELVASSKTRTFEGGFPTDTVDAVDAEVLPDEPEPSSIGSLPEESGQDAQTEEKIEEIK
jgi:hypothetical protein